MLRDHRTRFLIRPASTRVILSLFLTIILTNPVEGNPDAKRLYDDLLSHYNRLIRPVSNNSQVVTVRLGLHLTQLVDLVNNFILTFEIFYNREESHILIPHGAVPKKMIKHFPSLLF